MGGSRGQQPVLPVALVVSKTLVVVVLAMTAPVVMSVAVMSVAVSDIVSVVVMTVSVLVFVYPRTRGHGDRGLDAPCRAQVERTTMKRGRTWKVCNVRGWVRDSGWLDGV